MGQPILGPEDTAIGIDLDSIFVGPMPNGRYPAPEDPVKILDGVTTTKYLNFGGAGSGFIVTPALASLGLPVESFRITTANDAETRDPATWALYGHNGPLVTTSTGPDPAINPLGNAEAWTLIEMGAVALPAARQTAGPVVNVATGPAYDHYKMIFPTTKGSGIMQIADIQFYLDDAGTGGQELLQGTDAIIGVDEIVTPAGWKGCGTPNTDCSSSPANEIPARAIDRNPTTKYLNFGELNSGIIITNAQGPVDVNFMRITTANDAVERDPTSYQLYGTNDPITSVSNSNSNGTEVWTLISEGTLSLPGVLPNGGGDDARFDATTVVAVNSPANYTSYRLIFPTVKDEAAANSMQIADIQFGTTLDQVPEPVSAGLVALALACLVAVRRRS
jgi:hypothetical protein